MKAKDLGGQSAGTIVISNSTMEAHMGLTKRESFAMAAMQGILSSCPEGMNGAEVSKFTLAAWASVSARMADALLEELAKEAK